MGRLKSIMLVDDDNVSNFISETLIKQLHICECIEVFLNGQTALKYLIGLSSQNKELPELIFVDIHMPIMNGFEFLEKFNQLDIHGKEHIKLLGLTISDSIEDSFRLKELGCSYVLNKPLTENCLLNIVDIKLDRRHDF